MRKLLLAGGLFGLFLAWNMPYHAEHHAFPAVPFHNLPAVNRLIAPRLKTLKVAEPPKRAAGVKVADVAELVAKLKSAGVIA